MTLIESLIDDFDNMNMNTMRARVYLSSGVHPTGIVIYADPELVQLEVRSSESGMPPVQTWHIRPNDIVAYFAWPGGKK
jgi:hypothetical protein